jgi:ABC-2 type transport system permease protein
MLGSATLAIYEREMRKWFRQWWQLVFVIITPLMWMGLFGKSFNFSRFFNIPHDFPLREQINKAIEELIIERFFGGYDYFSFFIVGMMSVFILFTNMWSGMSLVFDRRLGYLTRFLVAPISRSSILMAKILASITRSLIQVTALFIIALALGLKIKENITIIDLALFYITLTILAFSLGSLFTGIAVRITSHDLVISIANLVNLPLMFASNAIFPIEQMPDYIQAIAKVNPLTYANIITRYAILGIGSPSDIAFAFIYLLAFMAVSIAIGIGIASRKFEE